MQRTNFVPNPQLPVRRFAIVVLATIGVLVAPASITVASTTSLQTVTTQDKTASVGLPEGWKLARGLNGFVFVTGPDDEKINLGVLVVAKNAPPGSSVNGEVAFALPFRARLEDKFTAIIRSGAAKQAMPEPELTIDKRIQTKLPMCARFFGGMNDSAQSAQKFEAVLCSLQPDYLGLYKNLIFLAQVPSDRAAAERALIEKVIASYRVNRGMFKRMLAPYTFLPPRQSGAAMPAMPAMAPYQDPTNSDCFDYNVIRESPPWEMPMHCGGWQPQ